VGQRLGPDLVTNHHTAGSALSVWAGGFKGLQMSEIKIMISLASFIGLPIMAWLIDKYVPYPEWSESSSKVSHGNFIIDAYFGFLTLGFFFWPVGVAGMIFLTEKGLVPKLLFLYCAGLGTFIMFRGFVLWMNLIGMAVVGFCIFCFLSWLFS
jgi:hypothetical protein